MSQPWIDRLGFQRQDTEDRFVNSPRLLSIGVRVDGVEAGLSVVGERVRGCPVVRRSVKTCFLRLPPRWF